MSMTETARGADTLDLVSCGYPLETGPDAFGFLRPSGDHRNDAGALQARLAEDGYLYLPGLLDREQVIAARVKILEAARQEGLLDPAFPIEAGVLREGAGNPYFRPDYTRDNDALMGALYDGPMMALFERLFAAPVRHFDYTWLRTVGAGPGTEPHCDIVYMGRGTRQLLTAWTPLGDIPLSLGGLMILENSHRQASAALANYLQQDVDSYCENGPNAEKIRTGEFGWEHWDGSGNGWNGALQRDPVSLRQRLGGRWLTAAEYRMGDILIFTMATVHASLDNRTRYLRLSSDTRYQRADEPIDERWIGEQPIGHGVEGKRGKIC